MRSGGSVGWSLFQRRQLNLLREFRRQVESRKFRTIYVSCPPRTQADFDPPSFPDGTCSACLGDGREDLQGLTPALTADSVGQLLSAAVAGPRSCHC